MGAAAAHGRPRHNLAAELRSVDRIRTLQRGPSSDDALMLAMALANLATLSHEVGDELAATTHLEEATSVAAAVGHAFGSGLVKLNIASLAQELGDTQRAQALAQSAMDQFDRERDRRGIALALAHLGGIAIACRELPSAHASLARSLQINAELGDQHGLAFVFDRFAALALASGSGWQARPVVCASKQDCHLPLPSSTTSISRSNLPDGLSAG